LLSIDGYKTWVGAIPKIRDTSVEKRCRSAARAALIALPKKAAAN
jgi:hypothetical protein